MKRPFSKMIALTLSSLLLLSGCGGAASSSAADAPAEKTELTVFAAASLTESMNEIASLYQKTAPDVTLTFNFDSSGTLRDQIKEGADCDIFISAGQKQMNQLDAEADAEQNPDSSDFVLSDTRCDLLQNKVVLIVPAGSDSDIKAFEDAATDRVSLMAVGGADVPVGQYTEQIYTSLGLWDTLNNSGKLTFGSNVKEVLSQVAAASADCGVVYATDAATEPDVTVAAEAPEGSHKPVVYPAAVMKNTAHEDEARAFLDFLKDDEASKVFESVSFTPLSK